MSGLIIDPYRFAGGGGGGGGFDPTTVANMVAWYDADDPSTITDTSGNVTQWDDKSGEANHMTVDTSVATYLGETGTRTINSLNVIDLDSTVPHVGLTGTWTAGSLTMFAVFQVDTTAVTMYMTDGVTSSNRFSLYFLSSGAYGFNAGGGGNSGGTTDTSAHMAEAVAGAREQVYIDGGTPVIDTTDPHDSVAQLRIGAPYVNSNYLNGAIGELLIYRARPSLSERNDILDYLANKWGIATTAYS